MKGSIVVRREHALPLAEARWVLQGFARRLQRQYGGAVVWNGNTLHFRRLGASGRVKVGEDCVEVVVEIGPILRPVSSRIEREIRSGLEEHLGAAAAGSS